MRQIFTAVRAACALLFLGAAPLAAEDAAALTRALAAVPSADWTRAEAEAARSGPLATDIIAWHRLRAGMGDFTSYADFAARNADWPGMPLLYSMAEKAIMPDTPRQAIIDWFTDRNPQSGRAALALLAALPADDATKRAQEIWRTATPALSEDEETRIIGNFGGRIGKDDHDTRVTALLDRGEVQAARRNIARAGTPVARLASIRADLQSDREGIEAAFARLPKTLQQDAGLGLDMFRWLVRAKRRDDAIAMMLQRSTSAEALGNPAGWAGMRADYTRLALREGRPALALRLAAGHHLPETAPHWPDLTFLAGYAALKSEQPDTALEYFRQLRANSTSPITRSRAHYWQARAHAAAGDTDSAADSMQQAAQYQTSYYGQLAAEALSLPMHPAFMPDDTKTHGLPDWRNTQLREDRRFQAAIWLQLAGDRDLAARFLLHMAETASPKDIARMARLMAEFDQVHTALRLAKLASAQGEVYPAALFPQPDIAHPGFAIPEELVLAIARQESEFNPRAGSHAGARGLMQLMPATARDIASQTGMDYDLDRISSDGPVNARFGAYYLRQLRDRFGPSVALVAAGYNAGPGRAGQWLASLGEIRGEVDPVDWVESIPFDETRNYVMRVAEALAAYRARLTGAPVAFTLHHDLSGGGVLPGPAGPRQTIPFTLTDAPAPPWKGLPPTMLPDPVVGPR